MRQTSSPSGLQPKSVMIESQRYRCNDCKSDPVNPRNLVIFIDGTSNKPGGKTTNVVKLSDDVMTESLGDSNLEQHKHYVKGIGAYDAGRLSILGRAERTVRGLLEQGLAWNVDKTVKDAYSWLVRNYRGEDQIYLFGFSRGAYQVRALAAVIHEVGLVNVEKEEREKEKGLIDSAYNHYLAIDPYEPETRIKATKFKQKHCWDGVRIHFVGVWDTVSSLGFIKRDVHVTTSASVTNACHFRHALALDEHRVKFMPEYFLEMNSRHNIRSPRKAVSDVKEVWFPGSHSDVGGAARPRKAPDQVHAYVRDGDPLLHTTHAGNVSFLWMRQEAAAHGLVFEPKEFAWDPKDVDFGTRNSMSSGWKIFEIVPIRHQVSFSGTGKHERRSHLSRPRSIVPGQQIHTSTLSGDVYAPCATLEGGVCIPTTPWGALGKLWTAELPEDATTERTLRSLLRDQQTVLQYLEQGLSGAQSQVIPRVQWQEDGIRGNSDFDRLAFSVVYDITSVASERLLSDARASLGTILLFPDRRDFSRTVDILRFLARHQGLRRRFIGHDEVIRALVVALERTTGSSTRNSFKALILGTKQTEPTATGITFLLVVSSLRHLICDDDLRDRVIHQLSATSHEPHIIHSSLSAALKSRSSIMLLESLQMITCLASSRPDLLEELQSKILELAGKAGGPVGSAAVEALVALNALNTPLTHKIPVSNILSYLGDILPPLDAEVGSASSLDKIDHSSSAVLSGAVTLGRRAMRKLVSAIESRDVHERTAATLTLLKLCRYPTIQELSSQHKMMDIFIRQLEQQHTCLLAAYALKTCLAYKMWTSDHYERAAQRIVAMLDKGWFDDAVGRVEGRDIFERLMRSDNSRRGVVNRGIIDILMKKLEGGNCHEVRVSLSCLNSLGKHSPLGLPQIVADNVRRLKDKNQNVRKKGVKVLAALAQTLAGEEAIGPHALEIVGMLPPVDCPSELHVDSLGPAFALYDLCKNENLRKEIRDSQQFIDFETRLLPLLPQTAQAT